MAGRTLRGREARRDVIRYHSPHRRRGLPSSLVAAVAIRVRRREGVVVAYVAVSAGHDFPGRRHLMRTRQRETGGAMVKGCGGPGDGVVARRAVRCRIRRSG